MDRKIQDYLHLYLGCTLKGKTGTVRLMSVIAEIIPCTSWGIAVLNGNQSYTTELGDYKPILRPLSDMTEEEKKEIGFEAFHMLRNDLGDRRLPGRSLSCIWAAKQTVYLLSRGFDLFNLIPDKLAINKTTLSL